jgi:hypothetical protein
MVRTSPLSIESSTCHVHWLIYSQYNIFYTLLRVW